MMLGAQCAANSDRPTKQRNTQVCRRQNGAAQICYAGLSERALEKINKKLEALFTAGFHHKRNCVCTGISL